MGILAWIHNRGGRDDGDMYGGVDRCSSPAVWADAMQRLPPTPRGIEIELRASHGRVRLRLKPGFDDLDGLLHMLTSTCALVEVRDRASESAA